MTEKQTKIIRLQILKLRQQLSTLEAQRSARDGDQDAGIWLSFLKLNEELSQFEQMLVKINQSISQDIQACKAHITANLDEYNHISRAMRDLEKFFMVNFLRPGYILKQARDQRAYLEKEYQRIRSSINNHLFKSIQEL